MLQPHLVPFSKGVAMRKGPRHLQILLPQRVRSIVDVLLEEVAEATVGCNTDGVKCRECKFLCSRTNLLQLRVVNRHAQIVCVGNEVFKFSLALLPRTLALKLNDRFPRIPIAGGGEVRQETCNE